MNLKKSALATALAGALALGTAPAMASVYAGSELAFSALKINFFDQDTGNQIVNLNPDYTFNVANSALLGDDPNDTVGFSLGCSSIAGNCGPAGATPVLTVPAANALGSDPLRANNDYSLFGPGSGTYANSNTEITDAQLVGDASTRTQQVAEAELQGSGQGQASADIQSNTTFTMNFNLVGDGPARLELNFDANPEMQALVSSLGVGSAQANMTFNFTLNQLTRTGDGSLGFATWSPNGVAAGNAICANGLVCSNEINPESLNLTLGVGPGDGNLTHSLGTDPSAFQLYVSGLTAGNYSLTLAALTSVNVTQQVPEPGTLLLLGGGLAALGFTARRRQRQHTA